MLVLNALGVTHDERHVHATFVGVLLVPLKGRVAGLRPTPRVVGVTVGPTDVVDALDRFVGCFQDHVEELHLVHNAKGATLLAGAVVGHQEDQRVVELTESLQFVHEAAELFVGVLQESGVGLLQASGQATLVLGQRVPGLNTGVTGRQLGTFGDEAHFELTLVDALTCGVPTIIELTLVLFDVRGRRLVGGVHGAQGEVRKERSVGTNRLAVTDKEESLVHEVLGEVVALCGSLRWIDTVVVVSEVGGELVRLTVEESVEAVEAALQRPLVVGTGCRGRLHGTEVPLTNGEGGVTLVAQHFTDGAGVV